MDCAFDYDDVKAEKDNAMRRYNFFRTLAYLFRFTEIFLALVLLSWVFTRIPFAVQISCHYARRISGIVGSTLFVFVVCNVIIATLFAKSGLFDGDTSSIDNAETEIYQEILKISGDCTKTEWQGREVVSAATGEGEYRGREVVSEMSATPCAVEHPREMKKSKVSEVETSKVYRRTQSEKGMMKYPDDGAEARKELRRSETEKHVEVVKNIYPHDNMSSEEFKRTVDEFIAERMRFLRQESSTIVAQNRS